MKVAPNLKLDANAAPGWTYGILAKKGAGKTYTGRVMAEELFAAKVPVVCLEPTDVWWGLRSSADGKGEGLPIPIFGGRHADVGLEPGAGKLMADLVVDEGVSMILSLEQFGTRAKERQFALDFLDRLYRRNDQLVHLIVDEADLFAPQSPQAGDRPLLGVMENLVRRGRNKGIGATLITQRPAVLNKDVLTQVDVLVAMRIVSPQDRDAIMAWVKGHGETEQWEAVRESLASLQNGESWWWAPEHDLFERVQVRRSRTFDSSPTRTRGDRRREPKTLAAVDLEAVGAQIAETVERQKASDPKHLRGQVTRLEREVTDLRRQLEEARAEAPEPERVEVPAITDGERELLEAFGAKGEEIVRDLREAAEQIQAVTAGVADRLGAPPPPARPPAATRGARRPAPPPPARPRQAAPPPPADPPADGEFRPSGPQQRILNALANLEAIGLAAASKVQLALFAEASPKSSSYTNNLGSLRTAGLIDYPGPGLVGLTDDGRAQADATAAPSSVEELHDFVYGLVGGAKARLLEVLIGEYPEALPKAELAERAGASAGSSSFTNNLGSLRSLGLIDYPSPGYVAALPVLFREGA